ncbi:hypothetical protein B0O80DRAFT_445759 [Mortierella sp. GBAus27b]|nr:hypothetical protein BGX31_009853 [Mortierella sp. GBA43]KAI8357761.1 hypothetical protein B0O80DRAFT_445759 [Mortierella sp. GBAus27b]
MSSLDTAISLAEIVALISTQLDTQALNHCVQVSKSWYEAFTPCLYRQVSYSYRLHVPPAAGKNSSGSQQQQHLGCTYEGFRKHGRHIRILHITTIEFPELDVFGPDCQDLSALHLHPVSRPKGAPRPQWNSRLQALLSRNPKIQTLEVHPPHRRQCEGIFFDLSLIKGIPELKKLTLVDSTAVAAKEFDDILACGPQLRELNYQISLLGLSGSSSSVECGGRSAQRDAIVTKTNAKNGLNMWTRMESLTVSDQVGSRAIELIERCPNLRNLHVRFWNDDNVSPILGQLLEHRSKGYPSRLEHIRIYRLLKDGSLLADVLRVCGESSRLKTFWLDSSVASHEVMTELVKHHAPSLQKVVLMFPLHEGKRKSEGQGYRTRYRRRISSARDLLSNCPRLRHLEIGLSDKVFMEDLIQVPWVCQDLEHLELQIMGLGMVVPEREDDEDDQVGGGTGGGGERTDDEEDSSSSSSSSSSSFASSCEDTSNGTCYGRRSLATTPAPAVVDLDHNIEVQRRLWQQISKMSKLAKLHIHGDTGVGKQTLTLSVTHGGVEALTRLKRLTELKISRGKHILNDHDREDLMRRMPNLRIIHPR